MKKSFDLLTLSNNHQTLEYDHLFFWQAKFLDGMGTLKALHDMILAPNFDEFMNALCATGWQRQHLHFVIVAKEIAHHSEFTPVVCEKKISNKTLKNAAAEWFRQ